MSVKELGDVRSEHPDNVIEKIIAGKAGKKAVMQNTRPKVVKVSKRQQQILNRMGK